MLRIAVVKRNRT